MRKLLLTTLSLLMTLLPLSDVRAQKVGLVLSGGGAKGLIHVGVIKALEENGIPIDYVAGTSMGAIISSFYAMGYSPEDMENLLGSDSFKSWYTGTVEPDYEFYFKKDRPTPALATLRAGRDSISTSLNIPFNVVSPIQMNLAFMQLYAQNTAACGGDFTRLFVPFRCIASDVYNKKELILRDGDLGDAVRASMSFPFVFKPIEMNGTLVYDGGIYNNFPTEVMMDDFHPDFMIGSVVATNPEKPSQSDIMSQLENMIMEKTDYDIPDSLGMVMTFDCSDINLMDFGRLAELEQRGYDYAMSIMDSLKARIHRVTDREDLQRRRQAYVSALPELIFRDINIKGATVNQSSYIRSEMQPDKDKPLTFEDVKKGYFRLLAGNMISEIIPHAVYDKEEGVYDLNLDVKMQSSFFLSAGGNLNTQNFNQLYLGVGYQDMNRYPKEVMLDGQIGRVYNNAQVMVRFDLPGKTPVSLRLIGSLSKFSYYENENIFKHSSSASMNQKKENFLKTLVAIPFLTNRRAEFGVSFGHLEDEYFQSDVIDVRRDRPDRNVYNFFGGSAGFYGSTLDTRLYATSGFKDMFVAQIYTGREIYHPFAEDEMATRHTMSWIEFKYQRESYHQIKPHFILGWMFEAVYAARNFSSNYRATMMQAAAFTPTAHSQMVYNEDFRANQYLAAGIKPIYKINDYFHLRGEAYAFSPIYPIKKNALGQAYYGKAFHKFEYMAEVSLVAKMPFVSVSAYVNHYSAPAREWNVGISLGWQLFNYRFVE